MNGQHDPRFQSVRNILGFFYVIVLVIVCITVTVMFTSKSLWVSLAAALAATILVAYAVDWTVARLNVFYEEFYKDKVVK